MADSALDNTVPEGLYELRIPRDAPGTFAARVQADPAPACYFLACPGVLQRRPLMGAHRGVRPAQLTAGYTVLCPRCGFERLVFPPWSPRAG